MKLLYGVLCFSTLFFNHILQVQKKFIAKDTSAFKVTSPNKTFKAIGAAVSDITE